MQAEPKPTRPTRKTITIQPPAVLRGRCSVCQTHRPWPVALPGTAKRFFCMTCERNTIHQQVK